MNTNVEIISGLTETSSFTQETIPKEAAGLEQKTAVEDTRPLKVPPITLVRCGEQRDILPCKTFETIYHTQLATFRTHSFDNVGKPVMASLVHVALAFSEGRDLSQDQISVKKVFKFLQKPWYKMYAKSRFQCAIMQMCDSRCKDHSWFCFGYRYPIYPDKMMQHHSNGRVCKVSGSSNCLMWNLVATCPSALGYELPLMESRPADKIAEANEGNNSPPVLRESDMPAAAKAAEMAVLFDAQVLSVVDDDIVESNMALSECGEYANRKQQGLDKRQKRYVHMLVAAHAERFKKQRSEMTVKQRNNKFREEFEVETNMFAINAVSSVWNNYTAVKTAVETVTDWKNWLEDKTKELVPHLLGLLAGWMAQPPTMMRALCDLLILSERINPELVRCTFTQFIAGAKDFIAEVCRRASSSTSANANPNIVETNASNDDEHLRTGSYLTLIGELLTGVRMKDRIKFAYKTGMSYGAEIKKVANYARATKEIIIPIVDFIKYYIKAAMRYVMFSTVDTEVDLTQFVVDVETILAYNDSDIGAATFPDEINTLWQQARKVRAILMTQKLENVQAVELRMACQNLKQFRLTHYVRVQQSFRPVRDTPFCIAFVGESGCGKSEVAPLFVKDMCDPENCNVDTVSDNASDLIFYDCANSFKEGYRAQPCWFRDDFMQKPENANTPSAESDALFLINAVSGTQMPLEMAHIEQKGMYFNSPLFVYTSNSVYPHPASIQSAEALQRRRNLLVYVTFDDKGNPVHPEEAISHWVDGVEVPERRLQYTDFHILPSVLKNKAGGIGDDLQFGKSMRPIHGKGISYTQLLEIACTDFNNWQQTSSAARMEARTPPERRFGLNKPKQCVVNRPDRFQVTNAQVLSGPRQFPEPEMTQIERTRQNIARQRFSIQQEVNSEVNSNMALTDVAGNHLSQTVNELMHLLSGTFLLTTAFIEFVYERCPRLLVLAAIVASAITSVKIYEYVVSELNLERDNDEVLIPKKAQKEFLESCAPRVRGGLAVVLDKCREDFTKLLHVTSDMAVTHGYGDRLMQSKAPKISPKPVSVTAANAVYANMGLENNLAVQTKVYHNMRTMTFGDGLGVLQAIGICGQWMLCNAHFFEAAKISGRIVDGYLHIRLGRNGYDVWDGQICMDNVKFLGDDLAVFKLARYCEQFPDIRKHFIKKDDVYLTNGTPARAMTTRDTYRSSRTILRLCTTEYSYNLTGTNEKMVVQNHYEGELTDFVHGDCGGPLINEPTNKICAIHSASNRNGLSIAAPVHAEMFDFMVEHIKMEEPNIIEEECFADMGDIVPVGRVPKQWGNYIVNKTDIVPSPVHGKVVEVTKAPSVKSLKDVRISEEAKKGLEPLYKSFVQYFDPVKDIPVHIFQKSMTAVKASLSTLKPDPHIGRRILTDDEVLNGVGTYPSIDISTSAGMPQRMYSNMPGKRAFFDRDPVTQRLSWGTSEAAKKFKADYDRYDELLQNGVAPFTTLIEQLKDETLKLEKVEAAKTRSFEVFPGPLALLVRKYSGAFSAALQLNCVRKPVSVGINPHSIDWKILYERLGKFGGKVIAGDYQAWDKRLNGQAIDGATEQENMWYDQCTDTPESEKAKNRRIRLLLAYMMIHSFVIVQRILYQKHQGMPSGVPVTSPRNSVANWLYLYSAIFSILEEEGLLNSLLPHELNEHVELALYGDDHIVALSGQLREHVTFRRVQKHFRERGVGYTDAVKSAASDFDFQDLTDITFLKRKFVPSGSRVYAPLDKSSVEDQLNWVRYDAHRNIYESFSLCYDSLIVESHLHGREYFEMLMEKLWAALQELPGEGADYARDKFPHSTYKDIWSAYNERYAIA